MGKLQWDPEQYSRFGNHRQRPFFDLVSAIGCDDPRKVVDLGCGPGNLTATLAERWPGAKVVGIDSSAEMIDRAGEVARDVPNLHFLPQDIAEWAPDDNTDVVVSNAALQWVPGHRKLLSGWLPALPAGAWVAVQIPANFSAPSHTLLRALAAEPGWSVSLAGTLRHDEVGDPAEYLGTLLDAGWEADVWETTYLQVLQGENAVLEWVRGTALRPVLQALPDGEREEFEAIYARLLAEAYPAGPHGTVYPFRRLFAVGHKPS